MKGLANAARQEMPMEGEEEEKKGGAPLSDVEELDVELASGLMANALLDSGIEELQKMADSGDPVPVIASAISTMVEGFAKKLKGTEMDVAPSVWLAEGGAVDQTIDLLAKLVDLPDDIQGAIFSDVVDQLKLMGKREKSVGQQPPPQQMGPPPMGQMDMAQQGGMQPNPMGGMPA